MATNVPDPIQSPEGPRYEGRLLDRPEDEVVDQGARFDISTLLSRRVFLGAGIASIGGLAMVACAPGTDSTVSGASSSSASGSASPSASASAASGDLPAGEIPDETAGPYPADGSNGPDVLEESGIVRSDLRTSIGDTEIIDGVPLTFTLTVLDMANGDVPFENAAVYAWHCNAKGEYSMYSEGVEDQTWLRGVQVADANGQVTFTSIMPGCYAGRWTHIHFEVYENVDAISDPENAISISQLAFPEESLTPVYELDTYSGSAENLSQITLETDNVFGDDGGELQIAEVTGDVNSGYTAHLVVRVDTTTAVQSGGGGGAPGMGGGPGGDGMPNGVGPGGGAGTPPEMGGSPGGAAPGQQPSTTEQDAA